MIVVKEIGLTVDPGNRTAIDFYEQRGWHKGDLTGGWCGFMRKPA